MNFICLHSQNNLVEQAIAQEFSNFHDTNFLMLKDICSLDEHLTENNIFIFNSRFVNELQDINVNYADKICEELGRLFKIIKMMIGSLQRADKTGKFIFITTNPGISHATAFPISPIYDEAIHSLVRSLAKEFKSAQIAFHGICLEPVFEMIDQCELRDYRKKMKVYAMQKSPLRMAALISLIKSLVVADFRLTSGNILYIAEGLDQVNF
jgi:hypothetical protein